MKRSSFLLPSDGLSRLRSTMSADMIISSTTACDAVFISSFVAGGRVDIFPGSCADAGMSFAIVIFSGSFSW